MKIVLPVFIEEGKPTAFNKRVYPKGSLKRILKKLDNAILSKKCFVVQDIWMDKAMEAVGNHTDFTSIANECLVKNYICGIVTEYSVKAGKGNVVIDMMTSNEAENVLQQYGKIDLRIDFQLIAKYKKDQTEEGYPIVDLRGCEVMPILRIMNVDRQIQMIEEENA